MIQEEYDSSFTCSKGISWRINLSLSDVLKFCKEHGKKMEQIYPDQLNEYEIIQLSFFGIQSHADAKGIEWDMWLDHHLEGDAYTMCRDATVFGIINFILPKLPEKTRVLLRHTLDDSLEIDGNSESKTQEGGLGQTSATSAPRQKSNPTDANCP